VAPATVIVCVECGGRAQLATPLTPDDVIAVGDVLMYRCDECWGRFDVVVHEDDFDDPPGESPELA
jgi:hypothetical protein